MPAAQIAAAAIMYLIVGAAVAAARDRRHRLEPYWLGAIALAWPALLLLLTVAIVGLLLRWLIDTLNPAPQEDAHIVAWTGRPDPPPKPPQPTRRFPC